MVATKCFSVPIARTDLFVLWTVQLNCSARLQHVFPKDMTSLTPAAFRFHGHVVLPAARSLQEHHLNASVKRAVFSQNLKGPKCISCYPRPTLISWLPFAVWSMVVPRYFNFLSLRPDGQLHQFWSGWQDFPLDVDFQLVLTENLTTSSSIL